MSITRYSHIFFKIILVVIALSALGGCGSIRMDSKNPELLERNRKSPPSFSKNAPKFYFQNNRFICDIKKTRLNNLKLGLRQLESGAKFQCFRMFYRAEKKCMEKYGEKLVEKKKVFTHQMFEKLQLSDIYFETLKPSDGLIHHDVWFHLTLKLSDIESSLKHKLDSKKLTNCIKGRG